MCFFHHVLGVISPCWALYLLCVFFLLFFSSQKHIFTDETTKAKGGWEMGRRPQSFKSRARKCTQVLQRWCLPAPMHWLPWCLSVGEGGGKWFITWYCHYILVLQLRHEVCHLKSHVMWLSRLSGEEDAKSRLFKCQSRFSVLPVSNRIQSLSSQWNYFTWLRSKGTWFC